MTIRLTLDQQRRLQSARLAEKSGNANTAFDILQQLTQEVTDDPLLLVEYAKCCRNTGRRDLAIATLKSLLKQHPEHATAMYHTGVMLQQLRYQSLAMDAYILALQGKLSSEVWEQIHISMAFMSERKNDLTAASSHVAELRGMNSQDPSCDLIEAMLCRRSRDHERAESLLRSCLGRFGNTALEMRAMYELANVLDEQQKYSQAYEILSGAKKLLRQFRDFDRLQKTSDWVSNISRVLTHRFEELKTAASSPAKPTSKPPTSTSTSDVVNKKELENASQVCLLTGHPRSGTTLLEQMLVTQKGISSAGESSSLLQNVFAPLVGCPPKVPTVKQIVFPEFRHEDAQKCQQSYVGALESRVRKYHSDKTNERWLIDKNPEAVVMIPVLKTIMPQSQIVVMIRDPRDVCLSCYFQYLPPNAVSINYSNLQRTAEKYLQTMKLWLAIRESGEFNYCEIRYEDLVTVPASAVSRVAEFLNLQFDADALKRRSFAKATETVVHSPTYSSAKADVYSSSIGRWKRYRKHFDELAAILDPIVDRLGYSDE